MNDYTVDCENVLQNMKRDICSHKLVCYVNIISPLYIMIHSSVLLCTVHHCFLQQAPVYKRQGGGGGLDTFHIQFQ